MTVIADRAEGLVGAEQAIRAAERLDDALVVDDLVEVYFFVRLSL